MLFKYVLFKFFSIFLIFIVFTALFLCGLYFDLFLHSYLHEFACVGICYMCYMCLHVWYVFLCLHVDFQVYNVAASAAADLHLRQEDAKPKATWWYKEESRCEEDYSIQHFAN